MEKSETDPFQFVSCSSEAINEVTSQDANCPYEEGALKNICHVEVKEERFEINIKQEPSFDLQDDTFQGEFSGSSTVPKEEELWEPVVKEEHIDDTTEEVDMPKTNRMSSATTLSASGSAGTSKTEAAKLQLTNDPFGLISYSCEVCEESFMAVSGLNAHRKAVHDKAPKFTCFVCKAEFSDEHSLATHQSQSHLGVKPYNCETCNRSFSHKYNLDLHKNKVHLGLRHNTCEICKKSFNSASSLIYHYNSQHPNLKPHSCEICKASFRLKKCLKVHQKRMHLELETFTCEECKEKYSDKKYHLGINSYFDFDFNFD